MADVLNNGDPRLNLAAALKKQSQKDLLDILDSIQGSKCLVIDPNLAGILSLVAPPLPQLTEEHGVHEQTILSAAPHPVTRTECQTVVYFARSSRPSMMKTIASHVRHAAAASQERHLYFVPRRTVACEKALEEEGVHHMLTLGEYPLYLVALDEDVVSFELDVLADADTSPSWHVANAIHELELALGAIPEVRAKGAASAKAAELLDGMRPSPEDLDRPPAISTLILLDREVDMVTPMCTQLTYEGLLDELLQIDHGSVHAVGSSIANVTLNSASELYREIRGLDLRAASQVLQQKAVSIRQDYRQVRGSPDAKESSSLSEMKDLVKKMISLPEIERHVDLAHRLGTLTAAPSFRAALHAERAILEAQGFQACLEHVEETIHRGQEPLERVLRLMVLLSLTNAGLPQRHFDYLRREVLHSYGFEHMSLLQNLEKAGLLKRQASRSHWRQITRELQLMDDESRVFCGYAPLSVRLVRHAVSSSGWRSIEQLLKLLPGPRLDLEGGGSSERCLDGRRALVLVVFIGGVTFAELAALRLLSSQDGIGCHFLVATTKIVNGNSMLRTMIANSKD